MQQLLNTVPGLSTAGAAPKAPTTNIIIRQPSIDSQAAPATRPWCCSTDTGCRRATRAFPKPTPTSFPSWRSIVLRSLADGASSVYGSDAVAGVINFITREKYDGVLVAAQGGIGGSHHLQCRLSRGTQWRNGSAMLAYSHIFYSSLPNSSRGFLRANHIGQGGTNFQSFNCSPATIQPTCSDNLHVADQRHRIGERDREYAVRRLPAWRRPAPGKPRRPAR